MGIRRLVSRVVVPAPHFFHLLEIVALLFLDGHTHEQPFSMGATRFFHGGSLHLPFPSFLEKCQAVNRTLLQLRTEITALKTVRHPNVLELLHVELDAVYVKKNGTKVGGRMGGGGKGLRKRGKDENKR